MQNSSQVTQPVKLNATTHSQELNWDIIEKKIYGDNPVTNINEYLGIRGFYNSDTGYLISKRATDHYHLFKNNQFNELVSLLGETYELDLSHFTTLKGGAGVLAAYKRSKEPFFIGEHEVKANLVIINRHDGGGCLEVGYSLTLYRCENMFRSTTPFLKVRHNKDIYNVVQDFKLQVAQSIENLKVELELINTFKDVVIDQSIIDNFKTDIFSNSGGEMTTGGTNKLNRFNESLAIEENLLGKNNGFSFLNAMTHYNTHNFRKDGKKDAMDLQLDGTRFNNYQTAFKIIQRQAVKQGVLSA